MKLLSELQPDNISNLFLYGAIMFANIDYMGITDYLIKAVIGGLVWFGFKLLQDHYSQKIKRTGKHFFRKNEHSEEKEK